MDDEEYCIALEQCSSRKRCTKKARLVFNGRKLYCSGHFNTLMSGEILCDYDGYNVIGVKGNSGIFFSPEVAVVLQQTHPDVGSKFVHSKIPINEFDNKPVLTSISHKQLGSVNGRSYVMFNHGLKTYGPYWSDTKDYNRMLQLTRNSEREKITEVAKTNINKAGRMIATRAGWDNLRRVQAPPLNRVTSGRVAANTAVANMFRNMSLNKLY